MNERILSPQLLKLVQAAGPGYSLADPEWVKKFAELIVKECMALTEGCRDKNLNSAPYKIAKHFGVEK